VPVDTDYTDVPLSSAVEGIQPMTGIVFWADGGNSDWTEIALEYSYMPFDDIAVTMNPDGWDWSGVEDLLDDIASRGHQAALRFYYVYPGAQTTVPLYIKAMDGCVETSGMTEGQLTWFPCWGHEELQQFTLRFYTEFAERYDDDPRMAFLQVGFGLWGEYHIYEPGVDLGVNFPDKAFQEEFFNHLHSAFNTLHWSISIDAADEENTPLAASPDLLDIPFGLFDDSFLHEGHGEYNADCFDFFGADRRMTSPVGGEFSYYTDYDQQHALDLPDGPHGISFEELAAQYNLTYIIGNDQPEYQTPERIEAAGMAMGYRFEVTAFRVATDNALVTVRNTGIAPIYYDAYVAVNGVRSADSLKGLLPGTSREYRVMAGGSDPVLTIECDRLVDGQEIFYDADI